MTEIKIDIHNKKRFKLDVQGHCEHDVCVSVSALVNATLEYTERFTSLYSVETVLTAEEYDHGNVLLIVDFYSGESEREFKRGISAIISGFELYKNEFPEDIKLTYVNAF